VLVDLEGEISPAPLLLRFLCTTTRFIMRVLISGYYGYGNLGDEALLSGIVTGLKKYGHSVSVLSGNPEYTRQLHHINAVSRYKGLPLALLQHDAIISGGGGLLQDKTSSRSLQYYLGVLSLAKLFRKKAIVYGQSIGPLSENGKKAVASTLKGVAVAVRDEMSQKLLSEVGIASELVADGALLLDPPVPPLQGTKLSRQLEQQPPRAGSVLQTPVQTSFPTNTAGGVLLFPRAGYPAITTALTNLAHVLVSQGHSVAGVSVQPNEDRRALESIHSTVPRFNILQANSPEELLEIIAESSYVVSGRLHGLILAAVARVNFCGLVYDPKVAAFLDEAGAPSFTLPIEQERLTRTVLAKTPVAWQRVKGLRGRAQAGLVWLNEQLR
jgi:polysaccharide pyruvyl transferase CsaB